MMNSLSTPISSAITQGIEVSVWTEFLPTESSLEKSCFAFAYFIKIQNKSLHTVQLMRRLWKITDGYGQIREVRGPGVVGEQPILAPGEAYQYHSMCDFICPVGRMEGFYFMENVEDNSGLRVRIPEFVMITPNQLN